VRSTEAHRRGRPSASATGDRRLRPTTHPPRPQLTGQLGVKLSVVCTAILLWSVSCETRMAGSSAKSTSSRRLSPDLLHQHETSESTTDLS
jgi:hypothetical protein